jgi:hypothetical protein
MGGTTRAFTKVNKYVQLRGFALLIAGLPGAVLLPFGLADLLTIALPTSDVLNMITTPLTFFSIASLMPAALGMFGLFMVAIATAFKKPINPESPRPKPHLLQIYLSVLAAAMPTTAFIIIQRQVFAECETNCFIFSDPAMVPLGIAYVLIWIALTTIWLRNRKHK